MDRQCKVQGCSNSNIQWYGDLFKDLIDNCYLNKVKGYCQIHSIEIIRLKQQGENDDI